MNPLSELFFSPSIFNYSKIGFGFVLISITLELLISSIIYNSGVVFKSITVEKNTS